MKKVLITAASFLLIAAVGVQAGGDAAKGEAIFADQCAECHYEDDFSGTDKAEIVAMTQAIVDGKTEHEDIGGLSAEDVANVAAYFASQ